MLHFFQYLYVTDFVKVFFVVTSELFKHWTVLDTGLTPMDKLLPVCERTTEVLLEPPLTSLKSQRWKVAVWGCFSILTWILPCLALLWALALSDWISESCFWDHCQFSLNLFAGSMSWKIENLSVSQTFLFREIPAGHIISFITPVAICKGVGRHRSPS